MGASLSIDKHGTPLEDWIQIEQKLIQVQYNSSVYSHLSIWRLSFDETDRSICTKQIIFQNIASNSSNVFNSDECYALALVLKEGYEGKYEVQSFVENILRCAAININKSCLQTCIKTNVIQQGQDSRSISAKFEYFTYAYFGKRSESNLKIATLSLTYKLSKILQNNKKASILTGGGVYKNKKLQIGSVIPFAKSRSQNTFNLDEYRYIHIISQLLPKDQVNFRSQFSLFTYKPKINIPIINQTIRQIKIQQKQLSHSNISDKSNQNFSSNAFSSNISKKISSIPAIKPPLLKLALKPFEDPTYEQVEEEEKNQKFDIRATARHQLKMEKFTNDCSMIIEGLYVSGQKIAKDQQMLKRYKITDIINCAGDYCLNWFQALRHPENQSLPKYNYLTFFLKDSQNENIQCLFYRVIEFINNAISNRRNVLIHCIQGISRSITFIIAYLIFTNGYDYKKAQSFVKQRRGIACPNNGFMVQLIQFYKRLNEKYTSLPSPRVFLVSSHCQQTPDIITARMLKQKLFEGQGKKFIGLDERGMYIIQSQDILYLWVGTKCQDEKKMKKYWSYAQSYIKKLQEHEKAPLKVKAIHQGNEGRQFLSLWGLQYLPKQYTNPQYDKLFNEQKPNPKAGYLRKNYERQQQNIQQEYICKLFIFPDYQNGLGVFELEDLSGLSILVKCDNQKLKIFVWKDEDWDEQVNQEQQFLEKLLKFNYASYSEEKIQICEESDDEVEGLSEEFLNCFN